MNKDNTDYRIEYTLNLGIDNRKALQIMPWAREAGEPTDFNVAKWRNAMNMSLVQDGPNFHISKKAGIVVQCGNAQVISNKTGRVLAEARQAMFETIPVYAPLGTYIPVIEKIFN